MIYLIFTQQGFEEAKDQVLTDKATLWINDEVLSNKQRNELTLADISIHILDDLVDPSNEKSVLSAIKHVEQHSPKTVIFVEYM